MKRRWIIGLCLKAHYAQSMFIPSLRAIIESVHESEYEQADLDDFAHQWQIAVVREVTQS